MSTEPASYICSPIPVTMLRPPQPLVPYQAPQQGFHPEFTSTERVYLFVALAVAAVAAITAALCLVL